jgi:Cu/Ag efflux protein CusF
MTAYASRFAMTIGALLLAAAASGCGGEEPKTSAPESSPAAAAPAAVQPPEGKKEFVLRGKVESVDTAARTMSVNHENVEGWMAAMTMTYKADRPEMVDKIKAGDQITAKVYEGDFTTLYDIQVAPAAH